MYVVQIYLLIRTINSLTGLNVATAILFFHLKLK